MTRRCSLYRSRARRAKDWPLGMFFGLLLMVACAESAPRDIRPNIVLVISDDQDFEHLGFMGHARGLTPVLDALAVEGTRFPVGYTQPRCRCALAVLLSGQEPHRSAVHTNVGPPRLNAPDLLPRLLRDAGYLTFAQGKLWEGNPRDLGFTHGLGEDHGFVRRDGQEPVFAFLEQAGRQPFFVWWAPLLPHAPHDAPARFAERFPADAIVVPEFVAPEREQEYRRLESASLAMVAWLDEEVGRLLTKLRELDVERDTLVIFLIDNGWANGLPGKGSPFEKGIRTPLVFHMPGRVTAGRELPQLVSALDIMPTILDFADVSIPAACDGVSLRPLLEGRDAPMRDRLFGAAYSRVSRTPDARPEQDLLALYVRTERWKYVRWLRALTPDDPVDFQVYHLAADFPVREAGEEDLYDLQADPYERNDLSGDDRTEALREAFRQELREWWTSTGGGELPEDFGAR